MAENLLDHLFLPLFSLPRQAFLYYFLRKDPRFAQFEDVLKSCTRFLIGPSNLCPSLECQNQFVFQGAHSFEIHGKALVSFHLSTFTHFAQRCFTHCHFIHYHCHHCFRLDLNLETLTDARKLRPSFKTS